MALIERVQSILLRPKQTWPVIAAEGGDTASIFTGYLAILAAIPAVAGFIGMTLFGIGGMGVTVRTPILAGLVQLVLSYLLSLAMLYVMSLVVNVLAPTFGGTKNQLQALKLVAYASTAALVAGIFYLLPVLGILVLIAALYSIYLFYTGVSVMMRCPPEKAGAYTAVVVVCGVVAGIVLAAVMYLVTPGARMAGPGVAGIPGAPANVTIKGPDGATVTINPSAMGEMAKRMEEAGKRMEAAQQSGDSQAAGKAMGEMLGAMTGGNAAPIAATDLKALLPEAIGDLKRSAYEASGGQAMGIAGSSAKATYGGGGERQIELSITDTGGLAGLAAMAGWANLTMDKETDGKIEKVYKDGARTVREEYQKDGSRGELTVILANGVIVEAEGRKVDMPTLKQVVAGVDLGRIEALKRAAK